MRQVDWAVHAHERYYVVRVDTAEVDFDNHDGYERGTIVSHRWWLATELARTTEIFAPRQLAKSLPPIIAGQYPPEPLRLDG